MSFRSVYYSLSFLAALITLSTVLFLQWGLGMVPCELCSAQRYGWYGILILSLIGWILTKINGSILTWFMFVFFIVCILSNILFTLLQLNVIYNLIPTLSSICTTTIPQGSLTTDQQLELLQQAPIIGCDIPARIFGISIPWLSLVANMMFLVYISIFNFVLLKNRK